MIKKQAKTCQEADIDVDIKKQLQASKKQMMMLISEASKKQMMMVISEASKKQMMMLVSRSKQEADDDVDIKKQARSR